MEEVPFDDRYVPRVEIDWSRSAWWWIPLTRAIQPAMRMNALAISLVAMVAATLGLQGGQRLFRPEWQPVFDWYAAPAGYWPRPIGWGRDVLLSLLSLERMGLAELGFLTFALLWLALIVGVLGGVLARRSLVELGQRTVAAWGESVRIVFSRWQSFMWAMGMHFVGIFTLLLPFVALGLFSRLGDVAAAVAGVLLLVCFPLVFAVGRFVLSGVVCFPLSVCAIAAEKKADAFEGFSRSNAYFFQRPALTALCLLCLLAVGWVGEQVVWWTISSGWWLIRGTYLLSGGASQLAADRYVAAGNWLAMALVAAYWFSFFWSGMAALYLVLRRSVDHTDLDELDSLESPVERSLPEIPSTPPPPPESSSADTSPT